MTMNLSLIGYQRYYGEARVRIGCDGGVEMRCGSAVEGINRRK
jgi:hypothetical protein